MSKRTKQKHMTRGAQTLKFLREQAKFSMRQAAKISGMSATIINHLENGRLDIKPHHLQKLLLIYGIPLNMYENFEKGTTPLPEDIRRECLSVIDTLSEEGLRVAYQVIRSISQS